MANFKVNISGTKNFINAQIKLLVITSDAQVEQMANETTTIIKQEIQNSIKRSGSTGNLANNFYSERIAIGHYGVGNIEVLNKNAPYWRWVNFGVAGTGRRIPPGTNENPRIKGHFEPQSNGRFVKGSPKFPMNPTKPIQAHNFIARTLQQIPTIVGGVLGKGTI